MQVQGAECGTAPWEGGFEQKGADAAVAVAAKTRRERGGTEIDQWSANGGGLRSNAGCGGWGGGRTEPLTSLQQTERDYELHALTHPMPKT